MPPQATPEILEQTENETELAQLWKVIVLNDPVNLMNYVVMVFRKVFGYGEQKAVKHMKEVHELGKSILWTIRLGGDQSCGRSISWTQSVWDSRLLGGNNDLS